MLLSPAGIEALRTALTRPASPRTASPRGSARRRPAVARNDFRAALRATADRDPLATLIRVFICEQTEPEAAVAAALARCRSPTRSTPGSSNGTATGCGWDWTWSRTATTGGSSRTCRPAPPGPPAARRTRARHRRRDPDDDRGSRPTAGGQRAGPGYRLGRAGTAPGHHARRVTATDVSRRALRFAATTAALNGQEWELLHGDLVAPVAGRRFDLVVSNPPFVVGPGTTTHVYRDSGRVGDAIGAELAAAPPACSPRAAPCSTSPTGCT